MSGIIGILYLVMFLGISAVGIYVCYHILRHSLSRSRAITTTFVFVSVFAILLFANAIIFFRIDWDAIIGGVGAPSGYPSIFPY